MHFIVEFIVEVVLSYPGALLYKLLFRTRKSVKEIFLDAHPITPFLGLVLIAILCFVSYQAYKILFV